MTTFKTIEGNVSAETAVFIKEVCATDFFDDREPVVVTRAPGRLDVMGGIADYSGSLVLQLPIADATYVALQKSESRTLQIRSQKTRSIEIDLHKFDGPVEYE